MRRFRAWLANLWWRFREWVYDHTTSIVITSLVIVAIIVYLMPDIIVTIGPGQSGVLWKRFEGGTITVSDNRRPFRGRIGASRTGEATHLTEEVHEREEEWQDRGYELWPYGEGLHLKWPWDEIFIYNIRLQQTSATYDVLTSDGLQVKAEMTIRWKPIEEDLGKLHRDIGPDYVNTMLIPLVGAFARQEIAGYLPDSLYSPDRLAIQERIRAKTKQALLTRFYPEDRRESYLMIEDILIRDVELPAEVQQAIKDKVVQKHIAESYEYRLQRERQEADRKAIEAEGIRRFQETINATISEGYLKWKGIDATLELAKSNNAKVVVIGAGQDGMPIILGGLEGAQGAVVAPARPAVTAPAPAATPVIGPPAPAAAGPTPP